uniref:MARVEL domain-containing protein n=1 Tax=Ditylenchus dipsaci TaxID=166011 RepID=A0A915E2F6_9BILA
MDDHKTRNRRGNCSLMKWVRITAIFEILLSIILIMLAIWLVDPERNVYGKQGYIYIVAAVVCMAIYLVTFWSNPGRTYPLYAAYIASLFYAGLAGQKAIYFGTRYFGLNSKPWVYELGQIFDEKKDNGLPNGIAITPSSVAGPITLLFVGFFILQICFSILFNGACTTLKSTRTQIIDYIE